MALIVSNDGVYITIIDLIILPVSGAMLFSTTVVVPLTRVRFPTAVCHMTRTFIGTFNTLLHNSCSISAPHFEWKVRDYIRYRSYIDCALSHVLPLPDDLQMAVDGMLSDIY